MQLYERGKFKLDDLLELHAPQFANVKVYTGEDAHGQPKFPGRVPRRAG